MFIQEPKLRSFPNKNVASRKMTGTEVAAEADRVRARRKAEKEQKNSGRNTKLNWLLFVQIPLLHHRDPFLHLF